VSERGEIAADLGLIGVTTRVVDRFDNVEQPAAGVIRLAIDFHNDGIVSEPEQCRLFPGGRTRAQRLDAPRDGKPRLVEPSIEREARRRRRRQRQADAACNLGGDDGTVDGRRDAVHEAEPVEPDQLDVLAIRRAFPPDDRLERQNAMRRRAALRRDRLGEARKIGGRTQERGRRDETSNPLAPPDQPLVDENLNRPRHREATDAEAVGELGFAVDAIAGLLVGDILPQPVHQLQIERPVDFREETDV
jgi:hypothetical protein